MNLISSLFFPPKFRNQIRQTLKKKTFEDAGIPLTKAQLQQSPTQAKQGQQVLQQTSQIVKTEQVTQVQDPGLMSVASEITLNRLNTHEADVEGFENAVKLEFEAGPEEVTGWNQPITVDYVYY